jgi:hypothetical protein
MSGCKETNDFFFLKKKEKKKGINDESKTWKKDKLRDHSYDIFFYKEASTGNT